MHLILGGTVLKERVAVWVNYDTPPLISATSLALREGKREKEPKEEIKGVEKRKVKRREKTEGELTEKGKKRRKT